MQAPKVDLSDRLSLAFETNGRACLGYMVQLPGAYVRAPTESEALGKVKSELGSYFRWLGAKAPSPVRTLIVQWHQSQLKLEDADSEILLDADRRPFRPGEFQNILELVRYSGETVATAYEKAPLKDWVDERKRRDTFYGPVPASISEILDHLRTTQQFYIARLGVQLANGTDDFLELRLRCCDELTRLHELGVNSSIVGSGDELWTLKKVMRRLIWHDRIHGKAMIRMLVRQRQLKLIDEYADPFKFLAESLKQSVRTKAKLISQTPKVHS